MCDHFYSTAQAAPLGPSNVPMFLVWDIGSYTDAGHCRLRTSFSGRGCTVHHSYWAEEEMRVIYESEHGSESSQGEDRIVDKCTFCGSGRRRPQVGHGCCHSELLPPAFSPHALGEIGGRGLEPGVGGVRSRKPQASGESREREFMWPPRANMVFPFI